MGKLKNFKENAEIKFKNGDVYVGDVGNGKPQGKGVLTYANGDVVVAEFDKGRFNGKVEYTFANGDKYEANYKKGVLDGRLSVVFTNGDVVVVEAKKDKAKDRCFIHFFNGDWLNFSLKGSYPALDLCYNLRGDKFNPKLNAEVSFILNNKLSIDAEIKNGKYEGKFKGLFTNNEKSFFLVLEGLFKNGAINEDFTVKLFNKNIYSTKIGIVDAEEFGVLDNEENTYYGGLKNGLPHGFGISRSKKKDENFIGKYENGCRKCGIIYAKNDINLICMYKERKTYGTAICFAKDTNVVKFNVGDNFLPDGECLYYADTSDIRKGNYINGALNGYGYMQYTKGYYVGQAEDGIPHGFGVFEEYEGDIYKGNFEHGVKCGYGTLIKKNGALYEGEFKNGKISGNGKIVAKNGAVMEGYFDPETGNFSGEVQKNGTSVSFTLEDGELKGNMSLKAKNGFEFTTSSNGDCKNGYVKLVLPNGSEYEGELKNGVPNGHGTLNSVKKGVVLSGTFVNGKLQGQGMLCDNKGVVYQGEFVDSVPNGKGKYNLPDNMAYEGEVKNGKYHGKGEFITANGNIFKGTFKEGKREGYFECLFKTGQSFKGEYKNDKPNGYGEFYETDGTCTKGQWKDGKYIG
ncbi:MAG: hypothetical protein IJZ26_00330 [Clostridia bacterium]|nr:hypothetical protein [Clostridia bacterium]